MESPQAAQLSHKAHVRYALRHLRMLPTPYQSDDSNRITFGFFALGSLAILGGLDRLTDDERSDYIHWIYQRWDPDIGGFEGAPKVDLRVPRSQDQRLDQPHLTHTYTALLMLALLSLPSSQNPMPESPYRNLDLPKLISFVSSCQRPNGSFGSFPTSPDQDVRFVYCAVAILSMVGADISSVINVRATVSFLTSCRRYEGGYGQAPYLEAQGGTTYCVLASLALLNHLEIALDEQEAQQTIRWLVDRQVEYEPQESDEEDQDGHSSSAEDVQPPNQIAQGSSSEESPSQPQPCLATTHSAQDHPPKLVENSAAGFQGRIGKVVDACYSFWCTASLMILSARDASAAQKVVTPPSYGGQVYYNAKPNIKFLLQCQSNQWGGFSRFPDEHPDVYHTYLALASLSISYGDFKKYSLNQDLDSNITAATNVLSEHDPLLNVPIQASQWLRKCFAS
ncbi:hypothetical protein O181_013644 [Austropuccinia psidii MF-1]|uniref:Prenyltransferase alpha-alpha toroid domain-containing protein n=1 Tax=Austropuccinia psidii MF-1 TaxID=1389203 RepID=A0A9Q3BYN3_9BASI|nr:hypothetical protein [Austropuccinia psidii MF-1]